MILNKEEIKQAEEYKSSGYKYRTDMFGFRLKDSQVHFSIDAYKTIPDSIKERFQLRKNLDSTTVKMKSILQEAREEAAEKVDMAKHH